MIRPDTFTAFESRHGVRFAVAALGVAGLVACGGSGDSSSPETPAEANCFDDGLYAVGVHTVVNYDTSHDVWVGNTQISTTVQSTDASFEGNTGLLRINKRAEGDETNGSANYRINGNVTEYLKKAAPNVYASYGSFAVSSLSAAGTNTRTNNPPLVDSRATLAVGTSVSLNTKVTSVSWSWLGTQTTTYDDDRTVKFVGIESVTVPAGTYTACRYDVSGVTEWWYRGVVIKSGGNKPLQMKSATVNGQPL